VEGRRAYQLVRRGIALDMPAKKVSIYALELKEFEFPYFRLACDVSSGFYVRSLAHDIGEKLGVGATVVEVRRTRAGVYHVEEVAGLDELLGCTGIMVLLWLLRKRRQWNWPLSRSRGNMARDQL
jgi:tRNA pseudouridine55 synthase